MLRIRFDAARSLTGMHAAGDEVELLLSAEAVPVRRKVSRNVQESMSGKRETTHLFGRRSWAVTVPLTTPQLGEQIKEFLDSCEAGESFLFEPYYVAAGVSLDLDFVAQRFRVAEVISGAKLESEGYDEQVLGQVGTGGADDYYSVNFTVIEA